MTSCFSCIYANHSTKEDPCISCTYDSESKIHSHWVTVDVFRNVDNKSTDVEQRRIDAVKQTGAIAGADIQYNRFPKGIGIQSAAGVKYDNGKPQWSLLPFKALSQVVEVLTYGAKKYAPDNWKKVPDARRRYIDAGFRHFTAYASGETHDPETGKHHLAHAVCCLLYLIAFDLGEHND
jgi:hypothetical protein